MEEGDDNEAFRDISYCTPEDWANGKFWSIESIFCRYSLSNYDFEDLALLGDNLNPLFDIKFYVNVSHVP